jgi:post-segregation antitoxin (ccd killing protein)
MEYVTVSAKVKRELYEKLKKYNISVSRVIRRALEEEIKRKEEEEIKRKLGEAQAILKKIPSDEIVNSIRESREER